MSVDVTALGTPTGGSEELAVRGGGRAGAPELGVRMRQMGIDDRGEGRFVGFGSDMEQPGPGDLSLADPGRGVGHALGAEIGRVAEDRREQRRGEPDRVAGAQMGEPMGEAGPGVDLGQEVGDVDLRHSVEDQPFRRLDLRLRHLGALFRDGQDAVDQADSGQLAGPDPVAQLLQLEVQLLLLLGYPGIGVARDAEPQISRLLACLKGRTRHELGFQRAKGPAALDPDAARPQAVAQHGERRDLPETPVPLAIGGDQFPDLLLQMAERHLGRQPAAIVPIKLSQEFDCRQKRIMGPGRPEGEGLEQRGRIAADPGIALGGAEQRVGLGGCGQGLDSRPGLDQTGPPDLAVEHGEGVLAGLIGFGERAQRVAEHAQEPSRLGAGIEMTPVLPGLGLGEQAGDQPVEQRDRGIGQLAGQLDQLRRDQRVPAPGVEVFGQPARRHGALAHQLSPPVRMDARAALRIKAERPDEA